jgi:hypothetical protein
MNEVQRAVVQQALEALEKARSRITVAGGSGWKLEAQRCINVITALRQLLEQPAAWVGLTPEQVRACFFAGEPPASSPPHWWEYRNPDYMAIYNNIEQRLKEKNT